jgi:fatty acid desaturase
MALVIMVAVVMLVIMVMVIMVTVVAMTMVVLHDALHRIPNVERSTFSPKMVV